MTEINSKRCLTCGIKDCGKCDVAKEHTVLTATVPNPSQQHVGTLSYVGDNLYLNTATDDVCQIGTEPFTNIEFVTCERGDWEVLKLNGEVFDAGHSIPPFKWIDLLRELGFTVEEKEISDEDMEEGNF